MIRYAITDRLRFAGDETERRRALRRQAQRLAGDGVDFLQVREKDLPFAEAIALAEELQATVAGGVMRVLVNSPSLADASVALRTGLGVHLTSATLGDWRTAGIGPLDSVSLVSASCHSLDEALLAAAVAKVLLFAPVFAKVVRANRVAEGSGLALLGDVCRAVAPLPVLAMGGVTMETAEACMGIGAAGVAGIRLFE